MKEENNIFVGWYDTLRYLSRYVDSRIMKVIEEEGFNKLDAIKVLKVSPYIIKLAEADYITTIQKTDTTIERGMKRDHKGPNHGMWMTYVTHYAEVA